MTADEAKQIADDVNSDSVDYADSEMDHVIFNIMEAAKKGEYTIEHLLIKRKEFAVANTLKNDLIKSGYKVSIHEGKYEKEDCYSLHIDWSEAED